MANVTLIFIIFLASTLLQLICWLYFFSSLAFYSKANFQPVKSADQSNLPNSLEPVSVIVCAHNELVNLKHLIKVLLSQNYPNFEIILVDDRSNDGTKEWVQGLNIADHTLKLIVISKCPQGQNPKKHALTKGIDAAIHDMILLTDADCIPISDLWIRSMSSEYLPNTKIVLGYSGYQKHPGLLNQLIRYETMITAIQYLSRALDKKPYMGVGRNLSYRKSYFIACGGFQEVLQVTGGDDDLFVNQSATRENTRVCLAKEAFTLSKPKRTWNDYFIQKRRHLSVGKLYKMPDKLLLGVFSVTHIIFWSSLVCLLVTSTLVYWVIGGFLIRQLALSLMVRISSRKLGERFIFGSLPVLDFLYSLFYLYTGIAALRGRKVTWQ